MNALDVLCAQLMRDLFAIAKFLFSFVTKCGSLKTVDQNVTGSSATATRRENTETGLRIAAQVVMLNVVT